MQLIDNPTLKSSEFIEEVFRFWYNDNQHIRSPFPNYIQSKLKEESVSKFNKWINNLHPDAKDELCDESIAEKFEEILFECAISLVITEDEKITILYPFLPRIDDYLNDEVNGKESKIIDRHIKHEGDSSFLQVTCQNNDTLEKWKTSFELPK